MATNAIKAGLESYDKFCGLDAASAWGDDEELSARADAAWEAWVGARSVLAAMFGITVEQVEEDMEQLMFDRLFC